MAIKDTNERIKITISKESKEKFKCLAAKKGIPLSRLLKQIIEEYELKNLWFFPSSILIQTTAYFLKKNVGIKGVDGK